MYSIATYLEINRNRTLGAGECAQAASEALRVSGWNFTRNGLRDSPGPNDYVWGRLIAFYGYNGRKLEHDVVRGMPIARGDIIQYHGVVTNRFRADHHTAIVRSVDPRTGLPTEVYEQNSDNHKFVQVNPLDLSTMEAGWLRIYRAVRRTPPAGGFEFSIVNRSGAFQRFEIRFHRVNWVWPYSLTTQSESAYETFAAGGHSYGPCLHVGNKVYDIVDGGGYEIVNSGHGPVVMRFSP